MTSDTMDHRESYQVLNYCMYNVRKIRYEEDDVIRQRTMHDITTHLREYRDKVGSNWAYYKEVSRNDIRYHILNMIRDLAEIVANMNPRHVFCMEELMMTDKLTVIMGVVRGENDCENLAWLRDTFYIDPKWILFELIRHDGILNLSGNFMSLLYRSNVQLTKQDLLKVILNGENGNMDEDAQMYLELMIENND